MLRSTYIELQCDVHIQISRFFFRQNNGASGEAAARHNRFYSECELGCINLLNCAMCTFHFYSAAFMHAA